MSIEIRPAKASDMELCAALYKEIYNTVYQGIVDSRLITSINQEDTVQRMRGRLAARRGRILDCRGSVGGGRTHLPGVYQRIAVAGGFGRLLAGKAVPDGSGSGQRSGPETD